jgi:FMN hydrolase / 5-amino-6-(5-phospho-D-ribitylamino)uracil phosphatase
VSFAIRAITLDLDDTLWPFAPVGERAERAMHAWLQQQCPRTAARFPREAMRALRDRLNAAHPQRAHDFSHMRRLTLEHALREAGDDPARADEGFEVFFAARNAVECFPDAIDALRRLAARVPLLALSNGNADLARVGLDMHFRGSLSACRHGVPKPSACIFHAACRELGHAPHEVLHVGDDIALDVLGAQRAGLRSCWINRDGLAWPDAHPRPDLEFPTLAALADWLDAASPRVPDATAPPNARSDIAA